MGKFEKHTSYIFLAGTVILFGISIYLLLSGGSSQGVTWGRFGDRMQGTIDGYSTLLLACILYHLINPKRTVNRQMGFTLKQASGVVEDYFHSGNLLKNDKYMWVRESEN